MPAPKNAPLYQQIYDEIKDAIEKGVYAPTFSLTTPCFNTSETI